MFSGAHDMDNNDLVPGFNDEKDGSLEIFLSKIEGASNSILVTLSGYIDTYNSDYFQKQTAKIISAGFKNIVFNCQNLTYVSSTGIGSLTSIEKNAKANGVLKRYIIQGYAINEKRMEALEKTVDIQTKMLASVLDVEMRDVLRAVNLYTDALTLLDCYDHQSLEKPNGHRPVYRITYEDCCRMVSSMEDTFQSDVFGIEKEDGKVEGILAAVYQNVFGGDVYPSLEEKAANLLYFMIKDHPYADGCKRIAASLFLEFLDRNQYLYKEKGEKRISDGALVAITLMVAESAPAEKDVMVKLIMNLLTL